MMHLDSSRFAQLARCVLARDRFLGPLARTLKLVHEPSGERRWEVYLGHPLPAHQTRASALLETWGVDWPTAGAPGDSSRAESDSPPSAPPKIALVWNQSDQELHVVRAVLVQGWMPYEESPGVITSRWETQWRRELVGTIDLNRAESPGESLDPLQRELERLVELSVVGTSRLPITSVESPLPEFAQGELAYVPEGAGQPSSPPLPTAGAAESTDKEDEAWRATWERRCVARNAHDDQLAARGLEFALRTVSSAAKLPELTTRICATWSADEFSRRWRRLFQQISLAPHTELLDRSVELLRGLASSNRIGVEVVADSLSYILRHLVRHLTAYDLVTFHSYGANYPDALWLDALLKLYLELLEEEPSLADPGDPGGPDRAARWRRRALRQAWLARLRYEGHRVPEQPTSQGERLRAMGANETTQPDSQLNDPQLRPRLLFADDPLDRRVVGTMGSLLAASFADLTYDSELRELGIGTFADRPLGIFKEPGEVDRTPFLSYEGSSVARRRERLELARARGYITAKQCAEWEARVESCAGVGYPVTRLPGAPRPGVIMLEDARLASDDFMIQRTTASSLREWADLPAGMTMDQRHLLREWADSSAPRLLIRSSGPRDAARGRPLLTLYDDALRPLAVWIAQRPAHNEPVYREAYGVEYLSAGLRTESREQ